MKVIRPKKLNKDEEMMVRANLCRCGRFPKDITEDEVPVCCVPENFTLEFNIWYESNRQPKSLAIQITQEGGGDD